MLVNENIDYYAGIFCFNPLDDPYHLERIDRCLTSIIRAAKNTKLRIKVVVGLNMSTIDGEAKIIGVGNETKRKIEALCSDIEILEYKKTNSCSKGYSMLLEHGKIKTDANKIVIFADDYIIPFFWFDLMDINFKNNQNVTFITPITSFVSQDNLRVNINNHPDWDIRISNKGDHKRWNYQTIYGGVELKHIDDISKKFVENGTVKWTGPPSFETTIFDRKLLEVVGPIHDEYFFCFYDNDYFKIIQQKGFKGLIAKNCFAFHYGKGGTKSLFKETADEKYKNSPVEHKLLSDVKVWNRRWGEFVKPWWGEK